MSFWEDVGDAFYEIVENGFWPPICRGRGYSRFRTYIFKSHLIPSMWPLLVEFRLVSSEGSGRKKKEDR